MKNEVPCLLLRIQNAVSINDMHVAKYCIPKSAFLSEINFNFDCKSSAVLKQLLIEVKAK